MKKFNNIHKIVIAIGSLCVMISACEVVDLEPVSDIAVENFWKTPDDAEAGAIAIYDAMQNNNGDGGLIWMSVWGEMRADVFSETTGNITNDLNQVLTNQIPTFSPFTQWDGLYLVINRANLLLTNVGNISQLTAAQREQYRGEAYFARALSYFYALRVWGGVPLITEPYTSADEDFDIPRAAKEAVLSQIEIDLDSATALLPLAYASAAATRGRATIGAAHALQTDVFLWHARVEGGGDPYLQRAVAAADAVLNNSNYALLSSEALPTLFFTKNTQESIFELQFNAQNNELQDEGSGGSNGPAALTLDFPYNRFDRLAINEQWLDAVEAGDLRYEYFTFNTETVTPRFFKYLGTPTGEEEFVFLDANIIYYRLADILLLKAEALNQLGDAAGAVTIVNQIRERAGLEAITASDPEAVKQAILQERYIEFAAEGKRWFDLIRNGEALSELEDVSDPGSLVWPINQAIIDLNPSVEQNELYK